MNSSRNTVSGLHIPYWATRKTWPRGRSTSHRSPYEYLHLATIWNWSGEDIDRAAEELLTEAAYRMEHEQRMVQELCAHQPTTAYPEGGWTCSTCGLWQWVAPGMFSINLADIKPYTP